MLSTDITIAIIIYEPLFTGITSCWEIRGAESAGVVGITFCPKLAFVSFFTFHTSASTHRVLVSRHADVTKSIQITRVAFEAVIFLELFQVMTQVGWWTTRVILILTVLRNHIRVK